MGRRLQPRCGGPGMIVSPPGRAIGRVSPRATGAIRVGRSLVGPHRNAERVSARTSMDWAGGSVCATAGDCLDDHLSGGGCSSYQRTESGWSVWFNEIPSPWVAFLIPRFHHRLVFSPASRVVGDSHSPRVALFAAVAKGAWALSTESTTLADPNTLPAT